MECFSLKRINKIKMMKKIIVFALIISLYGCGFVATTFTVNKNYEFVESKVSKTANKYFWDNYHLGNYDSIPKIIEKLSSALHSNPKDIVSTSHLGFVHIWALSERQRLSKPDPTITEHIFLSHKYFQESNLMNPHDLRVLGFLADLKLAEGTTLENKKEILQGYFLGLKSIKKWPQFNKFTLGYFFSGLDTSDKKFQEGLKWQYSIIDDCACKKNTKNDLNAAVQKVKKNKDPKINRACWNTWIAPHNWEGFCLNWGDMLTKNGEIKEAEKIYSLAKESDTYNEWMYKDVLEKRISEVNINKIDFNKKIDEINLKNQRVIMFNSKIACMSCHQMSKNEYDKFGSKELEIGYYISKSKVN